MPTIQQLVRKGREQQKQKLTAPALQACPQRRELLRIDGLRWADHLFVNVKGLLTAHACVCVAPIRPGIQRFVSSALLSPLTPGVWWLGANRCPEVFAAFGYVPK